MGYSTAMALILTAFPFVFAAISCFLFASLGDKTKQRALWPVVQACITTIGLLVTAYAKPNGVRYFGLFLANAGASGCIPGVLAYVSGSSSYLHPEFGVTSNSPI